MGYFFSYALSCRGVVLGYAWLRGSCWTFVVYHEMFGIGSQRFFLGLCGGCGIWVDFFKARLSGPAVGCVLVRAPSWMAFLWGGDLWARGLCVRVYKWISENCA